MIGAAFLKFYQK